MRLLPAVISLFSLALSSISARNLLREQGLCRRWRLHLMGSWCLVDPRPCTPGLFRASETNLRNKLNRLRIPTGWRQTSWLCISAAEALNKGLLETNPNTNHSTTLPPSSLLLAATYMKWILIDTHLCKRDRFLWDFLYNNIYHGSSRLFCGTCDLRRTVAVVLQKTIKMQFNSF